MYGMQSKQLNQAINAMIIAIDPGYTSGVCVADNIISADRFTVIGAIEVHWVQRFDFFATFFRANAARLDAIVIERFKLFPHIDSLRGQVGSEMPSSRVIGAVEMLAYQHGLFNKLTFQETWTRKQMTILADHRASVGLSKHNQDAYKHLRYYVRTSYKRIAI